MVALLSAETCAWAGVVTGCCWRLHPPSGDKCFSPSMDCFCSSPAPVVATMVWHLLPPRFPTSVGCVAGPRAGCVIFSWSVLASVRMGWMVWLALVPSGTGVALFVALGSSWWPPLATRCLGLGLWCGRLDNECPPWFGIGLPVAVGWLICLRGLGGWMGLAVPGCGGCGRVVARRGEGFARTGWRGVMLGDL